MGQGDRICYRTGREKSIPISDIRIQISEPGQAAEGDTLFTLVRRSDTLLTYWGAMEPQVTPLEDGTPCFKKDKLP
jgi:hypothetical protein